MEKLEKANLILGLITGIPVLLGVVTGVTGFYKNLLPDVQSLIVVVILVILFFLNFYILSIVRRIASPIKPPLVKSYNEPDTYIFIRGQWRKIPDWQTRDYLAHLLGFRPGEDDIVLKPKEQIDKLSKGATLGSIFTYSKK